MLFFALLEEGRHEVMWVFCTPLLWGLIEQVLHRNHVQFLFSKVRSFKPGCGKLDSMEGMTHKR